MAKSKNIEHLTYQLKYVDHFVIAQWVKLKTWQIYYEANALD